MQVWLLSLSCLACSSVQMTDVEAIQGETVLGQTVRIKNLEKKAELNSRPKWHSNPSESSVMDDG